MSRKHNYVVGFLFSLDMQHVALIQKRKPAWQAGRWNGVGGKLEEGEVWEDAMCREFHEETGVRISGFDWRHTVTLKNNEFECRFFRAFGDSVFNVQTVEMEQVAVHPVSAISLLPVIDNLRWLVPLQLDRRIEFPLTITDGLKQPLVRAAE